ncbi:MAG: aldo/keto reductase [Spirochaetales bacterium]|nr:aldo/keto reductase [Spirochaetales bacterium]
MITRIFGNTGAEVSEVGLGTWQLSGSDWGDLDEAKGLSILQDAADRGVTFFDTADVYGEGRSEKLIGRFLKNNSAKVFVATKLGRFPQPGWPDNFRPEAIRKHTEASLSRLGIEALDLTQFHCIPREVMAHGEVFESLRALKKEGKIKNFGASVESMEEALICLEQEDLSSLQIIFNIFRQKPIETLFQKAMEKNVAIIARVPLASGLLTGKMSKETTFAEKDHRNYNRDGAAFNPGETFAGLPFNLGVEVADNLKKLLPEGMSMTQMALRWILDFEAVSVVIPGASKPSQVESNCSVSALPPLSEKLHQLLKKIYEEDIKDNIRGVY